MSEKYKPVPDKEALQSQPSSELSDADRFLAELGNQQQIEQKIAELTNRLDELSEREAEEMEGLRNDYGKLSYPDYAEGINGRLAIRREMSKLETQRTILTNLDHYKQMSREQLIVEMFELGRSQW